MNRIASHRIGWAGYFEGVRAPRRSERNATQRNVPWKEGTTDRPMDSFVDLFVLFFLAFGVVWCGVVWCPSKST